MSKSRTSLPALFGRVVLYVYLIPVAVLVFLHYPYDTAPASTAVRSGYEPETYYDAAYSTESQDDDAYDTRYAEMAKAAADRTGVAILLESFVETYHLENKRVLEVGSGTGRWQDLVDDYTGLDISPAVDDYYHKPFVQASATDMPFPDNSFDAIWTVWVLEHVPDPEAMLAEMRRVLKDDGVLCLAVAWNCDPWLADGYPVRPYSDFGLWGRLVKASTAVRSHSVFVKAHLLPIRYTRMLEFALRGEKTPLRFRALEPNYDTYWMEDSDAMVSLDSFEAYLWFRARGDRLVTSGPWNEEIFSFRKALVVRVRKAGT